MKLVAVTGGIGSGKSVVCRILSALGYDVYDCDSRAKSIMDTDEVIKQRIAHEICADVITPTGDIDRRLLSSIVFADSSKLACLNAIVHEAVRIDLAAWAGAHSGPKPCFVETAILYQSGLDKMVDEVWEVEAPESVRIERVCRRNSLSPSEVKARIEAQQFTAASLHPVTLAIVNDGCQSLLLQVNALL